MVMTPNLLPIYGFAALTIVILCLFARQNRRSGWKRHRTESIAHGLQEFYTSLGVRTEDQIALPEWAPLNPEETLSFSAEMLKLRSALGSSSPVTKGSPVPQRELVHQ